MRKLIDKALFVIFIELVFLVQVYGQWSYPRPVVMSSGMDFCPECINLNNEQIWCVWWGYQSNNNFDIYASYYDGQWHNALSLTKAEERDYQVDIAGDNNGNFWVVYVSERNGNGDIFGRYYNGLWSGEVAIEVDSAKDFAPEIVYFNGKYYLFWYSLRYGDMDIFMKVWSNGQWSQTSRVVQLEGDDRFPTALADTINNRLWLAWTGSLNGNPDIFVKYMENEQWSNYEVISPSQAKDNRAKMAVGLDGKVWIVWDSRRNGNSDIFATYWENGGWSNQVYQLRDSELEDYAPDILCDSEGRIWVTWHGGENYGGPPYWDDQYDIFYTCFENGNWSDVYALTRNLANDFMPKILEFQNKIFIFWYGTQYGWENVNVLYSYLNLSKKLELKKEKKSVVNKSPGKAGKIESPNIIGDSKMLNSIKFGGVNIPEIRLPFTEVQRGKKGKQELSELTLGHIDLLSNGRVVVTEPNNNRVSVYNSDGSLAFRFGSQGTGEGEFNFPFGVCVTSEDNIVVSDMNNHRIQVFDSNGNYLFQFGSYGEGQGQFKYPAGVDANDNYIVVADSGNNRIQVFNLSGNFIRSFGALGVHEGEFNSPFDVAMDRDNYIYVADTYNYRFQKFNINGELQMYDSRNLYIVTGIATENDTSNPDIYFSNWVPHSIVLYRPDRSCSEVYSNGGGKYFNGVIGITLDNEGNIYYTETNRSKPEKLPVNSTYRITEIDIPLLSGNSVTLNWQTVIPCETYLEYGIYPFYTDNYYDPTITSSHSVTLSGLSPQSRYVFKFRYKEPFDNSEQYLDNIQITTLDNNVSTFDLQELRTAVIVYSNFRYQSNPVIDEIGLDEEGVQQAYQSAQWAREFYFRNSKMKLHYNMELIEIDEPQLVIDGDFSRSGYFTPGELLTPWSQKVELDMRKLGYSGDEFDVYIVFFAFKCYAEYPTGIFSWGRAKNIFGGRGFCAIPDCWQSMNSWLVLHENHHSLDGLLAASGFSSYYHADLLWEMPGDFGDNRDANAYMLRNWQPAKWFVFRAPWGNPHSVQDQDRDQFPDNDNALPINESLFGSSSTAEDTDNDSFSDYQEVLAGIYEGTNPTNVDTDNDLITDGNDDEPLYPVFRNIPFGTRIIDGNKESGWYRFVDSFLIYNSNSDFEAPDVYFNWDYDALYFGFLLHQVATVELKLDVNNDGWYHGQDNYQIQIHPQRGLLNFHVLDCSDDEICTVGYCLYDDDSNYPFNRLVSSDEIEYAVSRISDDYFIELAIYENSNTGLVLNANKQIGVQIRYRNLFENWSEYAVVFELDTYYDVTLEEYHALPVDSLEVKIILVILLTFTIMVWIKKRY